MLALSMRAIAGRPLSATPPLSPTATRPRTLAEQERMSRQAKGADKKAFFKNSILLNV